MKLRKIHTVIATFFIVCFTSLSTIDAIAQNVPVSQSDKIVENPDIVPMFTGGTAEMHRFISNTLSYPADAVNLSVGAKVITKYA
jgi:protein TonB